MPLPPLDPLRALEALGGFEQQHFYWEQPNEGLAIAAAAPCASVQFHGPDRFQRSQIFLRNCIAATLVVGPLTLDRPPLNLANLADLDPTAPELAAPDPIDLPFAGPHFYCSFTFFDTSTPAGCFPPATLFLPGWQVVRRRDRQGKFHCSFVAHVPLQLGSVDRDDARQAWEQYQMLRYDLPRRSPTPPRSTRTPLQPPAAVSLDPAAAAAFQQSVTAVLKTIAQGRLHKVVLAHPLRVTLDQPISALTALAALRQRHPECHIFSVGGGIQGGGQGGSQVQSCPIFLGASPERLLRVRDGVRGAGEDRQLQTEAIAGSTPRGQTAAEDQALAAQLLASPKEQHEHRLVSRFIVETLRQLGLNPTYAPRPQVLKLASIQHLQTPIHCDLPEHLHPLELLAKLHPTPAMAGVPQPLACEQIRQLERFERSLYAAPIGWIDAQGNCDFCVGIRSALIEGNQAQLFAGAGIVQGSQPQLELAEVVLKLRTLLAVLTGQR
ncbi:MAG: isochorismate synthase [Synechococcales cyanobacterium CRU_2_2]|nr:isochorismate synthase [Synechococcales cyanobacterium CRU_2_2]